MNRRMELSPRLRMVANLVPEGVPLADIGTDHAYLPAALIQEDRIPSAVAADLRQGPLSRARATVQSCGLTGRIAFRLCDGLSGICPQEADTVVIAGMGGETIATILEAAPWTKEAGKTLILQPMSSMSDLRLWLIEHGYWIREERLAQEGDAIYTALLVTGGQMEPMTPAELWVGRNSRDPLRGIWLDRWLEKTRRALDGLRKAKQDGAALRRAELEAVLQGLSEMKQEWDAWQQ